MGISYIIHTSGREGERGGMVVNLNFGDEWDIALNISPPFKLIFIHIFYL
jgi:hypothetical protein